MVYGTCCSLLSISIALLLFIIYFRAGFSRVRGAPAPRPPTNRGPPTKPLRGKGKEGEDGRDCPLSEIPNTLLGPRPPTS